MLHKFYANLNNDFEKRKFREKILKKCMVSPGTVSSWLADPSRPSHRRPSALARRQIAKITQIPVDQLFPEHHY